jgi:hypothetical protein
MKRFREEGRKEGKKEGRMDGRKGERGHQLVCTYTYSCIVRVLMKTATCTLYTSNCKCI